VKICFIILIFFIIFIGVETFSLYNKVFAEQSAEVEATIKISVCGNNVKEGEEQCDGTDLDNASCVSLGFGGGALSCGPSCEFDTSLCTTAPGGGATGGGGGIYTPPAITQVNLSGRAYPLSKVTVLKDGQIAITTIAGPDAKFNVSLSGLSSGDYTFSVYGEDANQRRSTLFTFPVFITRDASTNIGGIFIAPTIAVDKSEVKKGDDISIFGKSAPSSTITIEIASEEEFVKTQADKDGVYLYNFDTASLEIGSHTARSKSALEGKITSFGKTVGFKVGTKSVEAEEINQIPAQGDLNNDNRVNLIDFSVAAHWYGRPSPPAAIDLNKDGKVNLTDFSIMAYYWTG
jgi:hypothetical protein